MKEYLINNSGEYELHQGGTVPDGAIEVPEGAEFAVSDGKNIEFRKNDKYFFRGDWLCSHYYFSNFPVNGWSVIWSRFTQTKSLNDQYAEIEQVRQSQWSKQVGGNHYKDMLIQPAKFALENKLDYCQANAIKYICRHERKNGKEDLEKAKHYIDLLIEHHYG